MASSAADVIGTEEELDERLTRPRPELCAFMQTLGPRLVILGAGGKMGPTLAVLARRAADAARHPLEVIAVSRFSDEATRQWLETRGVQTLALDLLDRAAVAGLPDARQVIYLVGYKFGTAQNPARTWAVNTLVPAHVAERYPQAAMVALSTGNVYPLVPAPGAGSMETDSLTPLGEYANAAVARERIFDFHAQKNGTPLVLLRLNYAVDLRYGVLVDIARKVYTGQNVDVSMGYLNCIWQGDANDMILRGVALAQQPALVLNLTGSAVLSVRALARRFGELFDRPVPIAGIEANTALLSNSGRACALLGQPPTSIEQMMRWTAHWIQQGGRLYDRPTHFQTRDGHY
ncbi:MAG TPA: NAD-dependent epimerase/dehydratase family protein [Gemmataceae bacterium]|jgi:nucleoside-diphosphate-sugar epimerase|nr:NAD-dependent epimerase/dehydratase family protein [Gemmataceae bacterium]